MRKGQVSETSYNICILYIHERKNIFKYISFYSTQSYNALFSRGLPVRLAKSNYFKVVFLGIIIIKIIIISS